MGHIIRWKEDGGPDGLWVDARGVLWIQTDMSTPATGKGELAGLAHNMMLAADPATGEIRRFLTGSAGCEITGTTGTPDGRTIFVNIQHPAKAPANAATRPRPRATRTGRTRATTARARRRW